MRAFLGIDAGTSSVKVALIREDGALLATAGGGYETTFGDGARAEQNPDDWWEATASAIRGLFAGNNKNVTDCVIAGISVSSQTPSLVALDSDMRPLRPAMIWMDRRATEEKEHIERVVGIDNYRRILGNVPDAYYLLPKILWFKRNEPDTYARTRRVLMTNSYLNYRLTGVCATDVLQAIPSQAMDISSKRYSAELEHILDLPLSELLPPIHNCTDIIGSTTAAASEKTGLPAGIPVCAGTSDTMAAIFGLGIMRPGMMGDMTGTSSLVCFANRTSLASDEFLPRPSPVPEVGNYLVGTINSSGAAVEWYRKNILVSHPDMSDFKNMDYMAEQASAGCGGLLYFPYMAGERTPLWNSHARGMFIGMTMNTAREDLARSVLEGTSFALRHVVDCAKKAGAAPETYHFGGGGANSDIWLSIKASMLGARVKVVMDDADAAARGNTLIAGIGTGVFRESSDAVARFVKIKKVVEPNPKWKQVYDELYPFYRNMYAALDPQLKLLESAMFSLKEANA